MVIDSARATLTESFFKKLHLTLKNGTTDSRKVWFCVGDYKKHPNEVGGSVTTSPEMVATEMQKLLYEYNNKAQKTIEDIIAFHHTFEKIHPFQDSNGRVGRLIMLKECLKHNIVPFIIDESKKLYYYRGLSQFNQERGYLNDTCLAAQGEFKKVLDYFEVSYN